MHNAITIQAIGASPGIAIGYAFVLKKDEAQPTGNTLKSDDDVKLEETRFQNAIRDAVRELETLQATLPPDDVGMELLEFQIELLQDEQIHQDVRAKIAGYKNAVDAVREVISAATETFTAMDDEYFRARAADVQDVGERIVTHLTGTRKSVPQAFPENTILVADDIAPTDAIGWDITKVTGFATQRGGKTSHVAIVAKAKHIPAVVGCGAELIPVQTGDLIIVDGSEGDVIIRPLESVVKQYEEKRITFTRRTTYVQTLRDKPATTTDGVEVKLLANISNADEMESALAYGSEGSGLLRTELLFMSRPDFPDEEEQFAFYKNTAIKAKGKPVVIRTLDIGGDKQLPYFNLPAEENPFLGYRAIRISLDQQPVFITQLRAILRASAFGDVKIMLPMISNIQEVRQAKTIIATLKRELEQATIPFNKKIPVGIMIEIPSAAVTADLFAREVDFFSIGTNDLCQYTLAVDRMNERVKHLYDPFNPGVLRLIQQVIEQGNKYHIHTGMCGELAGDVTATLLLLGMGLRDFSMSATSIPFVKDVIIRNSLTRAKEIRDTVMAMDNAEAITKYLQDQHNE